MINNVQVFEEQKGFFIGGLFQISNQLEEVILEKIDCQLDNNSIYYSPKNNKLYRFCHRGMFGEGYAIEINSSLLPKEEANRIKNKFENWDKAKEILLTIQHKHSGYDYINVGWIGKIGERRVKALEKFPEILQIELLGIEVLLGESTISIK